MTEEMVKYYTIMSGKLATVRDTKLVPSVQSSDGGLTVLEKLIARVQELDSQVKALKEINKPIEVPANQITLKL